MINFIKNILSFKNEIKNDLFNEKSFIIDDVYNQNKKFFVYLPWIKGTGNYLVEKINNSEKYKIVELSIFKNLDVNRSKIISFVINNPEKYREQILRAILPIKNSISGLILTHDWSCVMRQCAKIFNDLNLPTILVPHESNFADRNLYYKETNNLSSVPVCDLIYAWGDLQKNIFIERGYPENRIITTGAPKFDRYFNFTPTCSRKDYFNHFKLDPKKKTILFAMQPLDSQFETNNARKIQNDIISDIDIICQKHDLQFIVRMPPSGSNLLSKVNKESKNICIDGNEKMNYFALPEDAIFHSDIICSINSTMLLEGLVMNKPSISTKYFDFDQILEKSGILIARDKNELTKEITNIVNNKNWQKTIQGKQLKQISKDFSTGEFDGQAANRIIRNLEKIVDDNSDFKKRKKVSERIIFDDYDSKLDVAIISNKSSLLKFGKNFVKNIMGANNIVTSEFYSDIQTCKQFSILKKKTEIITISGADVFLSFEDKKEDKYNKDSLCNQMNYPIIYLSYGMLNSMQGISTESYPTSLIIDDMDYYYRSNSRLNNLLDSDYIINEQQIKESRNFIKKITKNKISQHKSYNKIKISKLIKYKQYVLVVDQLYNDPRIKNNKRLKNIFNKMLKDAINENPGSYIFVLSYPMAGQEYQSYLRKNKNELETSKRVKFIDNVINPYDIINVSDKVYVYNDNIGYESLLSKKEVICYGESFYNRESLTIDRSNSRSIKKYRSVEEIFYFTHILLSRYLDKNMSSVSLEKIIELTK